MPLSPALAGCISRTPLGGIGGIDGLGDCVPVIQNGIQGDPIVLRKLVVGLAEYSGVVGDKDWNARNTDLLPLLTTDMTLDRYSRDLPVERYAWRDLDLGRTKASRG